MAELFVNTPHQAVTLNGAIATAPASGTVETWAVTIAAVSGTQFALPTIGTGQMRMATETTEIILVTAGTTTAGNQSWTVTRGVDSTTPTTHANGAVLTAKVTAAGLAAGPGTFDANLAIKTANYTLLPADSLIVANAFNITISLPSAPFVGQEYTVTNGPSGSNTIISPPTLAAPSAPVPTTAASGGLVLAGLYKVIVTYTNAAGETTGSAFGSVTTTGSTSTLTVPSPGALTGATGWYAYITQAGGSVYFRQQAAGAPTAIGTGLTLTAPPTVTGLPVPVTNTAGTATIFGVGAYAGLQLPYESLTLAWDGSNWRAAGAYNTPDTGTQYVNVNAFGATGNDTTDDTIAIQNAINSLGTNGGVVYFPAGAYVLGSAIQVTNPKITLRGAGMKSSILRAPISVVVTGAISVSAVDCAIEDLNIDGQYALQTPQVTQSVQAGIIFGGACDRLAVRRVYLHDTGGHGIDGASFFPTDIVIESCIISNLGTSQTNTGKYAKGIYFGGAVTRPTIKNCFLTGWSQGVGLWYGTIDGLIEGNRFINNYGYEDAITSTVVSATSTTVTLTGGTGTNFVANQTGSVLLIGTNAVFVTAKATDTLTVASWPGGTPTAGQTVIQHTSLRSALELYPNNTVGGRHRIIGNLIDGSTHNCIEVAQGEVGTTIVGNTFKNPGRNATGGTAATGFFIEVTGAAGTPGNTYDITISDNAFVSDGTLVDTGISIGSYTRAIKVVGNSFEGLSHSGAAGVVWQAGQTTDGPPLIVGNTFNNCWIALFANGAAVDGGVFSQNSYSTPPASQTNTVTLQALGNGWLIEGNTFENANLNGNATVLISSGSGHRIVGNRIAAWTRLIATSGTVKNLFIQGNYLTQAFTGTADGVIFIQGGGYHVIVENIISATTGNADLYLTGGADYVYYAQNTSIGVGGGVTQNSAGAHNLTDASSSASFIVPAAFKKLAANTVGTTQVTVAHGLGYTPTQLLICMTSTGMIWRSAVLDATNVSLTADAASRTCDVYVR